MSATLTPVRGPRCRWPALVPDAPTPAEAFHAARHFGALDALRGLSVLAVVWHHAADSGGPWGYAGVALFFAISGFLITTLLLREQARTGDVALGKFYMRRTLRIFPLYYAVLALYVLLVLATERNTEVGRQFFANLPYFATYTSNWFVGETGERTIFYFAWSLATEEQFYLFWPSLLRLGRGRRWLLPAGVMVVLLVAGQLAGGGRDHGIVDAPFVVRLLASFTAPICLGCLTAIAAHRPAGLRVMQRLVGGRWAVPALLGVTVAAIAAGVASLIASVLLAAVVAAACIRPDRPVALVEGSALGRALAAVGAVSYGMYLLQLLALNVVHRALPGVHAPAAVFAATAAVAFIAAQVSYRTLEQYFLNLRSRFR